MILVVYVCFQNSVFALSISNSAKHPTRICSGSFPTFFITILTFVTTVAWQECVEVSMKRNSNFGDFSHIRRASFSYKMNKRAVYYLLSKKTCKQRFTKFFWKRYNLEQISPKRQHNMCHSFCFVPHKLLLSYKIALSMSQQKNENQAHRHSTHYFLRLEMYKNQ